MIIPKRPFSLSRTDCMAARELYTEPLTLRPGRREGALDDSCVWIKGHHHHVIGGVEDQGHTRRDTGQRSQQIGIGVQSSLTTPHRHHVRVHFCYKAGKLQCSVGYKLMMAAIYKRDGQHDMWPVCARTLHHTHSPASLYPRVSLPISLHLPYLSPHFPRTPLLAPPLYSLHPVGTRQSYKSPNLELDAATHRSYDGPPTLRGTAAGTAECTRCSEQVCAMGGCVVSG